MFVKISNNFNKVIFGNLNENYILEKQEIYGRIEDGKHIVSPNYAPDSPDEKLH